MAEDTSVSNDISWALTLERQTEANVNTGELMGTMEVLGLDVSAGGLWNIDKSGRLHRLKQNNVKLYPFQTYSVFK